MHVEQQVWYSGTGNCQETPYRNKGLSAFDCPLGATGGYVITA